MTAYLCAPWSTMLVVTDLILSTPTGNANNQQHCHFPTTKFDFGYTHLSSRLPPSTEGLYRWRWLCAHSCEQSLNSQGFWHKETYPWTHFLVWSQADFEGQVLFWIWGGCHRVLFIQYSKHDAISNMLVVMTDADKWLSFLWASTSSLFRCDFEMFWVLLSLVCVIYFSQDVL